MKRNIIIATAFTLLFLFSGQRTEVLALTASVNNNKFVLVIDAGHGGKDPGAIGRFSREKNINLSVAKKFGQLVEQNCPDVKVIYTRKSDIFVPLDKRADIANKANADLFISIHTNAMPGRKIARGAETYTLGMARADANLEVAKRENSVILIENDYKQRYEGFDPNSAESYIIFEFMQDKYMAQSVDLAKEIQKEFRTTAGRQDKGVHQAGFLVLRQTSMPSVLVELGYISTHDEEAFLNSQNGISKLSQSIFNAFVSYYKAQDGKTKSAHEDESSKRSQKATVVPEAQAITTDTSTVKKSDSNNISDIATLVREEKTTTPVIQSSESATKTNTSQPVFKIQLLTSSRQLHSGSSQLKGLSPVDYYKEDNIYKYTYGETTDYQEAKKIKNKIKDKFGDAFIVAFLGGIKIELKEAINIANKNK